MSAIYRVYLKDEILEFGRKDQSGVFLCQNTAFMFFSALIDQFPDMDMQSFARKFQGVAYSDEIGGGLSSPKAVYDCLKECRNSFEMVRGRDRSVYVMAEKSSEFLSTMKKQYRAEKNIPDFLPAGQFSSLGEISSCPV